MGLESNEDEGWFLGFDHEGQDVFMKECEVALEDCMMHKMLRKKEVMFLK